eukprot:UC1_evm1s1891
MAAAKSNSTLPTVDDSSSTADAVSTISSEQLKKPEFRVDSHSFAREKQVAPRREKPLVQMTWRDHKRIYDPEYIAPDEDRFARAAHDEALRSKGDFVLDGARLAKDKLSFAEMCADEQRKKAEVAAAARERARARKSRRRVAGSLGYEPKDPATIERVAVYKRDKPTFSTRDGPALKPVRKLPPVKTHKQDWSHVKSSISTFRSKPHKPGGGQIKIPMGTTYKRDPKRFSIPEPPKPKPMSPGTARPWRNASGFKENAPKPRKDNVISLAIQMHAKQSDAKLVSLVVNESPAQLRQVVTVYERKFGGSLRAHLERSIKQASIRAPLLSLFGPPAAYEASIARGALLANEPEIVTELLLLCPISERAELLAAFEDIMGTSLTSQLANKAGEQRAVLFERILSVDNPAAAAAKSVDEAAAKADAETVRNMVAAGDSASWGFDSAFWDLMREPRMTPQHLVSMVRQYRAAAGAELLNDLESQVLPETGAMLDVIVRATEDPIGFMARRLQEGLTASAKLRHGIYVRIIIARGQRDVGAIVNKYAQLYASTLESDIEANFQGNLKRLLLGLLPK